MKDIKCSDCDEYRNEWCEKIIDSPHPDIIRDCQYWHKRKDMVEVIRCKDCKHWEQESICDGYCSEIEKGGFDEDHYCSYAERRTDDSISD